MLRAEIVNAATLDAEVAAEILGRWVAPVEDAVARHGGRVEDCSGAAIVVTFGLALAHEDDPLRAARAALDIRALPTRRAGTT